MGLQQESRAHGSLCVLALVLVLRALNFCSRRPKQGPDAPARGPGGQGSATTRVLPWP